MTQIVCLVVALIGSAETAGFVFDESQDRPSLIRGRLGLVLMALGLGGLAAFAAGWV